MAAATITFSKVSNENAESVGSRRECVVLMKLVTSTSTYTGGLTDSTNFPLGWQRKFDMNTVRYVVPAEGVGLLRTADATTLVLDYEAAYHWEIDLTNRKLILYGGFATPAENEPLSEIADGTTLEDGTFIAKVRLIGT